jgi:hypothetical protein
VIGFLQLLAEGSTPLFPLLLAFDSVFSDFRKRPVWSDPNPVIASKSANDLPAPSLAARCNAGMRLAFHRAWTCQLAAADPPAAERFVRVSRGGCLNPPKQEGSLHLLESGDRAP